MLNYSRLGLRFDFWLAANYQPIAIGTIKRRLHGEAVVSATYLHVRQLASSAHSQVESLRQSFGPHLKEMQQWSALGTAVESTKEEMEPLRARAFPARHGPPEGAFSLHLASHRQDLTPTRLFRNGVSTYRAHIHAETIISGL